MGVRIVVDPITRIEGHLRIEAKIEGGKIRDAWSSGQMWRGIEVILRGRHPNDAWLIAQRICGVCTTVHAIVSVRAVESALKVDIPLNAQYIRNLIIAAHALHDHIVHFYHLSAVDWVDVVSALSADPKKAASIAQGISDWHRNSVQEFTDIQNKLKSFVAKGKLGIFTNGYWGHPAMKLPPEVNLLAVVHYLQALEYQRYADSAIAILGGKNPHIQNLTVGGVTTAIDPDDDSALNFERIAYIKELLSKVIEFVHKVYLPDVLAIATFYPEWLKIGCGVPNYLAVPDLPLDSKGTKFDLPGGILINNDLKTVKEITSFNDPFFKENVEESIAHSWYKGSWTKHPFEEPAPEPDYTNFDKYVNGDGKYSWVKSPRFVVDGKLVPMQVGPVSQVLVGYALSHPLTKKWVDFSLQKVNKLSGGNFGPEILMSTLGRHAARAIRAAMIADVALKHLDLLVANIKKGDLSIATPVKYPKGEVSGFGFHEAPRGTLSHWVVIENGRIKNYQAVVPSTWNAGPRDGNGNRGPYEEALIDNPIADPEKPLEVLRTIHSFDPCIACAIHLFDPNGREVSMVRAL